MFIPTISENDALKQARDVFKSITPNVDYYDFEAFFKEVVYLEDGIYQMKGSKEVYNALRTTYHKEKVIRDAIYEDMKARGITKVSVYASSGKVFLRAKRCYYEVKNYADYVRAIPALIIMARFRNYEIKFDYVGEETVSMGGKIKGKDINIFKYDDGWLIDFPNEKRLGRFGRIEDARMFIEQFA